MARPPAYKTQEYPRRKDFLTARWFLLIALLLGTSFVLYRIFSPPAPHETLYSDAGAVLEAGAQAKENH